MVFYSYLPKDMERFITVPHIRVPDIDTNIHAHWKL